MTSRLRVVILAGLVARWCIACSPYEPAVDLLVGPPAYIDTSGADWKADYSLRSGLSYLVTFPVDYDQEAPRRWPLVVFLHSADERGRRIARLYNNTEGEGVGLAGYALQEEGFRFVTLTPLCPSTTAWSFLRERLYYLIDDVATLFRVDRDSIYLSGVEMGGTGVWAMVMAYPDLFAAAAPIAGSAYVGTFRRRFEELSTLPIWVFHDGAGRSSRLKQQRRAVAAIRAAGGDAKLSVLGVGDRQIQEEVFRGGELFDWFLEQRR